MITEVNKEVLESVEVQDYVCTPIPTKIIANSVFSKYSILHKKQKEDAVFKEDCPSSLITKISIFHNSYMQHFTILYKIKKIQ